MNKTELIKAVAKEANLTQAQAKQAVDAVINTTTAALKAGDQVCIPGVCTVSVATRAERTGKNLITGEPLVIPAKKVVKFKAGKSLNQEIN